jgi:hypothetical protein
MKTKFTRFHLFIYYERSTIKNKCLEGKFQRDSASHMQFICRSARIKTSFNSWYTTISAAAKSLHLKRLLLQTMTACKRRPSRHPKKESKESEKSQEKRAAKYATKLNIAL